jgi:hypothetical protein
MCNQQSCWYEDYSKTKPHAEHGGFQLSGTLDEEVLLQAVGTLYVGRVIREVTKRGENSAIPIA